MAKKDPELQLERARKEMAIAHDKRLKAIDRVADTARSAENTTYDKKMQALDMAAGRVRVAAEQVSSKAGDVVEKAEQTSAHRVVLMAPKATWPA